MCCTMYCNAICNRHLPSPVHCIVMYPYTAERRELLGNTLPRRSERFPKARDFAFRGPRDCVCTLPRRRKYFPMHPDSRQCTAILSVFKLLLAGKYWFCVVTTDGAGISQRFIQSWTKTVLITSWTLAKIKGVHLSNKLTLRSIPIIFLLTFFSVQMFVEIK